MFGRPDHPVEIVQVELPAGQSVALPASSYAHIRQAVWVQIGELVIRRAASGTSWPPATASASARPAEVTFANETDAPCTYVVVLARS